jgi:hypothetical protein
VTLDYKDIAWLFRLPDITPFSEDFQVYSATYGIEFIVNELRANSSLKRVEATILLPPDQITPDLEGRTREAVRRYCQARSHTLGQDERILRDRIKRSLVLAVVATVLSVGIGYPLSIEEDFVLSLIGNILYFFGWVAIWYPMDAIVFGRRDLQLDVNAYERVMEMQVSIQPDPEATSTDDLQTRSPQTPA